LSPFNKAFQMILFEKKLILKHNGNNVGKHLQITPHQRTFKMVGPFPEFRFIRIRVLDRNFSAICEDVLLKVNYFIH